jgi:hypothetical protein
MALGWTRDGRAVIAFPHGGCGGAAPRPGTYLVDVASRRATLVFAGVGELWG